ncbi:hypothetical protein TRIUR3_21303 [Triticum urartu]|uniref:Uncharacterized protein n=1 Tax=Triticum urartu TaxID=4572 RepID=M7Z1E3_TRIUA|nr:hypothetical protein TRIUR3_21303 [Triticum urartu]
MNYMVLLEWKINPENKSFLVYTVSPLVKDPAKFLLFHPRRATAYPASFFCPDSTGSLLPKITAPIGTTGGGRAGEVALQAELGSTQTSSPASTRPSSPPTAATRDARLKEAAPLPRLDPPHQPAQ